MSFAARPSALMIAVCAALVAVPTEARAQDLGVRVFAVTGQGDWLSPTQNHAALSRELPSSDATNEPEAVRLVFLGARDAPTPVRISTVRSSGQILDTLAQPAVTASPCPPNTGANSCWSTLPLRLTPDRLDRDYPAAHERSLEAELGGELQVHVAGKLLQAWRIGAPHSAGFAGMDRLSLKLRVRVLRIAPDGAPAVGGDPGTAVTVARNEVLAASKLWAQCGVDLVGPAGVDVAVVDPPPVQLIAVGCESGLPASGGQLSVSVSGRRVRVTTRAGEPPRTAAERLARAVRATGSSVRVSANPRSSGAASGVVDLLVRGPTGGPIELAADPDPRVPLSTDPTLNVCLGEVDLGNGLTHFVENDAAAGTLEERALVKAFDDGDPSTVEVFLIPSFEQSGRIGESFIDDGPGIQNTVIIDRAAVRAGPRSYALAHELGHVLLDMPGHPDDYGIDQSDSLMDSDASDASVFGPRRLSLDDCERMLRESGPNARIPLLTRWPLPKPSTPAAPTLVR